MANTNDIATTIASALSEVGVSGKLDVAMDGNTAAVIVGQPGGDDVRVEVLVTPVE